MPAATLSKRSFALGAIAGVLFASVVGGVGWRRSHRVEQIACNARAITPPLVTLAADGEVAIDGRAVGKEALLERLREALERSSSDQMDLRLDPVAPKPDVIAVLSLSKQAGAMRVRLQR